MTGHALATAGDWLRRNGKLVQGVQWVVVWVYVFLLVVPTLLELPDETAHLFTHLTVFAQFVFWGIWWPFVLLSMVLLGRVWCGVLCPEGSLSEWTSRHGRDGAIPRWMRWGGWPFVAFVGTTVYGQMVSVYQYPQAALLVLGGSTVAAMLVGYLYGREKRVWCKYLCPVSGVFGLLSKLAPVHFRVDGEAWRHSYSNRVIPIQAVNCAPLVAMRKMEGASDCHMCGRCSGHRDAVTLSRRSPNHEIVVLGEHSATGWQTALILLGLLGVAMGAFQWTVSPQWVQAKQFFAEWLIDHGIFWPLAENAPWWVLTHYPELRDVFSWLDGAVLLGYIGFVTVLMGLGTGVPLALATRLLGTWQRQRFYHLCQALIPVAGCGVFLGLSALTVNLLKNEGVSVAWANDLRLVLLAGANAWTLWLALGIVQRYTTQPVRRAAAWLLTGTALLPVNVAWVLMFWWW